MTGARSKLSADQRTKLLQVLQQRAFRPLDPEEQDLHRVLDTRRNVVFYGPPGTGKTYRALRIRDAWRATHGSDSVWSVTFHPSYSYEDFVEGFRPDENDPSKFIPTLGPLLLACEAATKFAEEAPPGSSPRKVLLFIDEINRGDVARIFGELITYIEADKRGETFRLAQSPLKERSIPVNLCFLGTMNTADKSVSLLDVALRRRFAFIEFPPLPSAFSDVAGWASDVGGVALAAVLQGLNARLKVEGVEVDRSVGHALLGIDAGSTDPVATLKERFRFDIHPLVEEYLYLDRQRLGVVLEGMVTVEGRFNLEMSNDEFIAALKSLAQDSLPPPPPIPPAVTPTETPAATPAATPGSAAGAPEAESEVH